MPLPLSDHLTTACVTLKEKAKTFGAHVAFPPGRLRLATRPNAIGSLAVEKTIGMVPVAARCRGAAGYDHRLAAVDEIGCTEISLVYLPSRSGPCDNIFTRKNPSAAVK
jgi:hypothetical protein